MILEEISRKKHRGWASCAAVCKEWQMVIESENFRRLNLGASCIAELENVDVRQRDLVRHIRLDIELPRYTRHSCKRHATWLRAPTYQKMVKDAIFQLFSALNTWQPNGHRVLELHASTPSDSEHYFKNYQGVFEYDHDRDVVERPDQATTLRHDPKHGWYSGYQLLVPGIHEVSQLFNLLFSTLPEDRPGHRSPTSLSIRLEEPRPRACLYLVHHRRSAVLQGRL